VLFVVTAQEEWIPALQLPAELLIVMDVRTSVLGRGLVHQTVQLPEEQAQPATAMRCAPQVYAQATYAKPNISQAPISAATIPALLHPVVQQTPSAQLATIIQPSPAQQLRHILHAKQQILLIIVQYAVTVQAEQTPVAQQHAVLLMDVRAVMFATVKEQEQETVQLQAVMERPAIVMRCAQAVTFARAMYAKGI
jgi:hypothetical protein